MWQVLPAAPVTAPIEIIFRCALADLLFLRAGLQFLPIRFEEHDVDGSRRQIIVARFLFVTIQTRNLLVFVDYYPTAILEGAPLLKNCELFAWRAMDSFQSSAGFPTSWEIVFDLRQNAIKPRVQDGMKKKRVGFVIRHWDEKALESVEE